MTSIRKHFLVFLGAVAATCLLFAPSASAEFHLASAPATLTGSQTTSLVLTTNSGTVTCKTITLSGTQSTKTTSELSFAVKMESCTAFGFIAVPIHWNGCEFKFTSGGAAHIICPAGKPIEITVPGCTYLIGAQTPGGSATYTTSGSAPNRHIIEHWNFSGLSYIECGTARTNGTWKGSTTTKASTGDHWWSP
jgi:hypothetical protein